MGLLDQVLGNVLGGNTTNRGGTNSPLMSILLALLAQRGGGAGGLRGLLGGLTGSGVNNMGGAVPGGTTRGAWATRAGLVGC